jgi:hypothetical protein
MLRRLLKILAALLAVLAVAALILVWGVLGVNPFEGRQDHLWRLVSNDVDFFVRWPAAGVLDEPAVRNLEQRPGYEAILRLRELIRTVTRDVAQQVNPQIPGGVVEIDIEKDLLGREMALAGVIRNDYQQLRVDHFVAMTRIAWHWRFVSALQRGFVRDRVAIDVEPQRGQYLQLRLDPRAVQALAPFRAQRGGAGDQGVVYVARIRDVLLVTDNRDWIEDALRGGADTLPLDPDFETEFIRGHRSVDDVELYARGYLVAQLLQTHAKPGTPLFFLPSLVPLPVAGDVTVRASATDGRTVELSISNKPQSGGFERMKAHERDLYNAEKGDVGFDLSENGIGRFIPKKGTVAAVVLHAKPEELVPLLDGLLPADEKQLLDDEIRQASGSHFTSLEKLLRHLTQDLADSHLIVLHRPSVFDTADFSTFRSSYAETLPPEPTLSVSLVSRVKDHAMPDKVREEIFRNLKYLGMEAVGPHESGEFHRAKLVNVDIDLVEPAYGAMKGGMRYVVFSSSVEAAEAIYAAADSADNRLLGLPGIAAAVARLPGECSFAAVVNGETLGKALRDRVWPFADVALDLPGWKGRLSIDYQKVQNRPPTDEEYESEQERYISIEYPKVKERYERMLRPVDALDAVAIAGSLGVGGEKKVEAKVVVQLLPPPESAE